MIRAAFFDVGNTLLASRPREWVSLKLALAARGVACDAEEAKMAVLRAFRFYDDVLMPRVIVNGGWQALDPGAAKRVWELFGRKVLEGVGLTSPDEGQVEAALGAFLDQREYQVFEDVPEALHALRQRGLILGIISNWDCDLSHLIETLGIGDYFSCVACSSEVGVEKPDVEMFRAALDATRVAASEAVHVGNELWSDIWGASEAGLCPVLLDRDGIYADLDIRRISNLDDLIPLLHQLGSV